jgi:hypothetical protein
VSQSALRLQDGFDRKRKSQRAARAVPDFLQKLNGCGLFQLDQVFREILAQFILRGQLRLGLENHCFVANEWMVGGLEHASLILPTALRGQIDNDHRIWVLVWI